MYPGWAPIKSFYLNCAQLFFWVIFVTQRDRVLIKFHNPIWFQVAQIRFPRRQFFFAQTESVATRRRYLLEVYLRRLLVVCSKIPGCPLYEDDTLVVNPATGGLRKAALIEFSSFFLRGLCECEYRSETEESVG